MANIERVTASIKFSKEISKGIFKTLELGAEASPLPTEAWQEVQAWLYDQLVAQLRQAWRKGEVNGQAQEPPPAVPSQAQEPQPAVPSKIQEPPPAVPSQGQEEPVCPRHQTSTPSQWGGLFCPTRMDDGTYCKWKYPPPARQAKPRKATR